MGRVTISMLYVIRLCIFQNTLPVSDLSWEVCYIYLLLRRDCATAPQLYLTFIDMFVHCTMVHALICLCMLYNIIVGCTLSWNFCPIYLL